MLTQKMVRYDVFKNRMEKSVNGAVRQFTHDLASGDASAPRVSNVWADLDGSRSLTTRRIFADGIDQPLARITSGSVAWYLTDWIGSVREIADNTSGAFVHEVRFNGFGQIISEVNPGAGDRYKWQGREFDIEFSQYHFRARYYDPATGRFTSEDLIASELATVGVALVGVPVGQPPLLTTGSVPPAFGLTITYAYDDADNRVSTTARKMRSAGREVSKQVRKLNWTTRL